MGKAENLAGQRRIGFVLYPISANISYGKGDASETNIADKLSNAHGFIRGHQQVFLMAPDRIIGGSLCWRCYLFWFQPLHENGTMDQGLVMVYAGPYCHRLIAHHFRLQGTQYHLHSELWVVLEIQFKEGLKKQYNKKYKTNFLTQEKKSKLLQTIDYSLRNN
ncbi:hypothetical protein YC2023_051101 [Brassica napus]